MHRFLTQIFNIIVILIAEVRPQEDLGDVQEHFAQSLNLCLPWIEEAFDCGRPARKVPNYQFRFSKVVEDSL